MNPTISYNAQVPFIKSVDSVGNVYQYDFSSLTYTSGNGDFLIHLTHPETKDEARELM